MKHRLKAISVYIYPEEYHELRKKLLDEHKSVSQWIREKMHEYLYGGAVDEREQSTDRAQTGEY